MKTAVASIIFAIGIAGLFFLDRGKKSRVSRALWIPTAWLFITFSRPASQWLGLRPEAGAATVYIEGSPVDRAVYAVLEALALIVVISRGRRSGLILRRHWVLGLFFLYAALSMSWSDYPFITLKHWIKGIGDVVMVLVVLTEPSVVDAIRRLLTRLGFVLIPLSVLFIKYYPSLGRRITLSWTSEATGVTTQKNGLGQICTILGLGLLWRFRAVYNNRGHPKRLRRLLALSAVLSMVVWLLSMCNSMTSICALSIGGGVMLLSGRTAFSRRPARLHVVIAITLGVVVYALFFQSSGMLLQGLGRSPTLTGRTEIWKTVLSIPNNRLVGAGYETFWMGPRLAELWERAGFDVNEAHNGYIELLLNLGWIGVALLGILIATGYRNAIAAYRHNADVGPLCLAFLLAALIASLTEAAFRMLAPPWTALLLAITVTPAQPTATRSPDPLGTSLPSRAQEASDASAKHRK